MSQPTTRPLPVCKYCRDRKIKCDFHQHPCRECRTIGLECVRTSAIKFKYHRSSGGSGEGQKFPSRQVWTALPRTALRYHDETPELIDLYDGDESAHGYHGATGGNLRSGTSPKRAQTTDEEREMGVNMASTRPREHPPAVESPLPQLHSSEVLMSSTRSPQDWTAWGANTTTPSSQNFESPWAQSVDSQLSNRNAEPVLSLSATEALLLRNYTENMALWADGTDPGRSFELEASKRAITDPILLYAICAFSSRHINRHRLDNDPVALEYQSMCLQLLIPAISGPEPVGAAARAAVAILRQNEEMDEEDERFHLEGVTRILDNIFDFPSSDGLGEATAWLCLREEIYISLTMQKTIRSSLAMFKNASWIQGVSDGAWANRMVLLLADLLSYAFADGPDDYMTDQMRVKISDWNLMKPVSFRPIRFLSPDSSAGRHLPEIWMLASLHAVAIQYYHIAQLVLTVSARTHSSNFVEYLQDHQSVKRQVRHHLLTVVGIAVSNPRAQNTWFTAHHCLAVWGRCLRKHGDQQACLDFLQKMQDQTGWRVGRLRETLAHQWEDDVE